MSLKSENLSHCKLFDPSDKIPDFEIDDVTRKALCFREDLIVSLKGESASDTKPLGGYSVSIESIGPEGMEFMTQVISSSRVKDSYSGSKVLSSTTSKLHCLEEKRREYIHREDGLHEKTLFMGLEEELYHLEGRDLCSCDEAKWQKDLPLCSNCEIISEGANVLLMRYLALKNFHGSLSFQSVTIDGQLTTCNYRCSEAQIMELNGHKVEVYTVERRMHEECGLVHNVKTYMTRGGNILRHDWLEVPYLLEINSMLDPNNIDHNRAKIVPPLRSAWNNDVQMMSLYLDKKTCKMAQQSEYLADHPEIKQLISDYAQTLLAVKPINVLPFTIQHFAAFAKCESNLDAVSHKARRICSVCGICFDCLMPEQPLLNSEGDRGAPGSPYSKPKLDSSEYSLCSVFTKCPSDASCVRKSSRASAACSEDCKACRIDNKMNSACSFSPECEKTCDGCVAALKKPCDVHRACPECPGCHKVCSEIGICPNCKNCNIEILPDSVVNDCKMRRRNSGAESNESVR